MNLKRLIYPCAFLAIIGITALTAFKFYRKEKPFYVRLKNRKKRPIYQLHNVRIINGCSIFADLINKLNSRSFVLEVNFTNDEILRFQITDPHYERYVVHDVIILEPDEIQNELTLEHTSHILEIHHKELKIEMNSQDFEIKIHKNNILILSINTHKEFIIEEEEPNVAVAADFFFNQTRRIYGFPQHAENLSLKSTTQKPYRLYNVDRFAYSSTDCHQSLYGAVPLIYAVGTYQTTGLLWLNSSETYLDIEYAKKGISATLFSESGCVEFYVLTGSKLSDCVKQNSQLTGVTPLPPLFALGYHQCRFSYMTQEEVVEVSNKFDENNFPLDTIWMDIDYTNDKKYFTWNPETYPHPDELLKFLKNKKRKAIAILDPHVKVDDYYSVYAHCKKEGFLVKTPDKDIFMAKCWPGVSSWIDFCNPRAREFYANLHIEFAEAKNLHIWNDMNEPALFESEENSMPKNTIHYGNWKHRDVHNLYGFYQTMATYKGLMKRKNHRPFILTRSHFAGSQRFAAIWTGDNVASWSHLAVSIPMCLTASLVGFSLCGADIGGFVKHPDDELLQRWYQLGAWLPFFRGHSNRNVPRREPYQYNTEIQQRIRDAFKQRYQHLLYWYTLFWQHYSTSEPVIRPLIYQYPDDENLYDFDRGFLVGREILITPVMTPQATELDVYLPGGSSEIWYYNDRYEGTGTISIPVDMDTVPVFYRGGSIIPIVEDLLKSSAYISESSISLSIFCDKEGKATGTLYCDDTESFDYLQNSYIHVRFNLKNSTISGDKVNQNANYNKPIMLSSINLYGYGFHITKISLEIDKKHVANDIKITKEKHFIRLNNINTDIKDSFRIVLINN